MQSVLLPVWTLILLLSAVPVAAAAPDTENAGAVPGDTVAAAQAWELIQDGALVIDVRSHQEFAAGHLHGAVNVPHTDIDGMVREIGPDRDRPVVLYCRSGRRAGEALAALAERGYSGGFNATGLQALEATRPDTPKR